MKDLADYVYSADNRLAQVKNTGGGIVHSFGYDQSWPRESKQPDR